MRFRGGFVGGGAGGCGNSTFIGVIGTGSVGGVGFPTLRMSTGRRGYKPVLRISTGRRGYKPVLRISAVGGVLLLDFLGILNHPSLHYIFTPKSEEVISRPK